MKNGLSFQKLILSFLIIPTALFYSCDQEAENDNFPNIIIILADDMGYGDPSVYNPESKIPTPNIDQLAEEGMMFTDAHTTSSVCTPTRYGIITGEYSWRSALEQGVTWSYDTSIIARDEHTVGDLLSERGYTTACIGKWHLGLGWQQEGDSILFDRELTTAPVDLGFDYFYGMAASLDIPPYVYIENDKVVMLPDTVSEGPAPGFEGAFWREGPVSPDFNHYETLDHFTDRSVDYIKEKQNSEPFFLYFALTAPHLPWLPGKEYEDKSEAGEYGDFNVHVDEIVGRITAALKETGQFENTLLIFTSDNGSQFSSTNMEKYEHKANLNLRGRKGDIYEGGHRVPFIVVWPGKVEPGSVSTQLVSTTDFYATFADLTGKQLEKTKDSQSFLPALTGTGGELRSAMIYHSAKGMFALRDEDYVLIEGKGSGGFLEVPDTSGIEHKYQLYNLVNNISQKVNLYKPGEEVSDKLKRKLEEEKSESDFVSAQQ
jgi:arylsulfatase A-like enzyme